MKRREARTEITADKVLRELARIGFFDIRKALNADGSLKPLDQLDDDTAVAIAGIEIVEMRDREGNVIGPIKKIRLADKLAALNKLAKHLGLLDQKLTLEKGPGDSLALLIQSIQGNSLKPVPTHAISNDFDEAA